MTKISEGERRKAAGKMGVQGMRRMRMRRGRRRRRRREKRQGFGLIESEFKSENLQSMALTPSSAKRHNSVIAVNHGT